MATIERYQNASGKTLYTVRYRTPEHRQTRKRGFVTKRDAQMFAATVEVSKARGEYISASAGRVTIGELGPSWLQRQKGHMKPSGFRSYESAWTNHVEPRWGAVRVGDVRFSDVAAWVAKLSGELSASMVATVYSVLARILDDSVRDRMLTSNPARGVKLPRRPPRRNVYLSADQLNQLADESGRYGSLVFLLGVGGLRWGEAAALRVGDVDFLGRRIELHRNAVQVGREFVVGSLKSNENRTVVLPKFVIDALAQTAKGKGRDDLLWPSASGGHLGPPSSHDSWLSGAVARCRKADPTFPRHGPRTAAHRSIAGHQRWGEPEGGSAHARARQCSHDAGRIRRSVRVRPRRCSRDCVQNVSTVGSSERAFDTKNALSCAYTVKSAVPSVRFELTLYGF